MGGIVGGARRVRRLVAGLAATSVAASGFVALSPWVAPVASAATFTLVVNSPNVDEDGTSPGQCAGPPLGVAGECTLQAAMQDAQLLMGQGHDITVEFAPNVQNTIFQPGSGLFTANPALYYADVPSGRTLQINGPGLAPGVAITLFGADQNRIFDFTGTGNVVIRDLLIGGGRAGGVVGPNGGAIRTTALLTLDRVSVRDSFAAGNGGGIWTNNDLIVRNSTVSNNTGDGGGGGISITGPASNLTLTENTQLASNGNAIGGGVGGGVECNCQSVRVENGANLTLNVGRNGGGAIWATGANIALSGAAITANVAFDGPGGGIYAGPGSSVTMNGGTIAANISQSQHGGGIACDCTSVSLFQVELNENGASTVGGAIAAGTGSTVSVSFSNVISNEAGVLGGAIDCADCQSVGVLRTTMDLNDAGFGGAAIAVSSPLLGVVDVTDSIIRRSTAFQGAAIRCLCNSLTVVRSLLEANAATDAGGAVYSTGNVQLTNSTVVVNSALGQGGGVFVLDSAQLEARATLFDGNESQDGEAAGGAIGCNLCGPVAIDQSTFVDNVSSGNGGAATIQTDAPVRIADTTFSRNSAEARGAAVFLASPSQTGIVELDHITVADHTSPTGAGAIAVDGVAKPAITLRASIIADNQVNCDLPLGSFFGGAGASIIDGGGCPHIGPTIVTTDPGLLPLTTVGGASTAFGLEPMPVHPILGTSVANDLVACTPGSRDARGMPRTIPVCDAGAFELDVEVFAGADLQRYPSPAAVVSLSEVPAAALTQRGNGGADSQAIAAAKVRGTDLAASPLRNIPLRNIGLAGIELGDDVLSAINLAEIPLAFEGGWVAYLGSVGLTDFVDQPLNTITLRRFLDAHELLPATQQLDLDQLDLSGTPLGSLTVGAIALAGVPLDVLAGSTAIDWCATYVAPFTDTPCNDTGAGPVVPGTIDTRTSSLVALSLEGIPLRNIPLRNIPLRNINLANIPIEALPLRNIPLRNIDLSVSPLRNIPLRNIDTDGVPGSGIDQAITLAVAPLRNIQLRDIDLAASPLRNIPLRNIPLRNIGDLEASPLRNIPLRNIPLRNIDLEASPLRNIPLRNIPLRNIGTIAASPLRNIPLRNIPLAANPLRNIGELAASPLRNIPLRNIDLTVSPLRNIPLRNIGNVAQIVDCGAVDCASLTLTLGDAPLRPGVTLGVLVDNVPDTQDLGTLGDVRFGPDDQFILGDVADAFHVVGAEPFTLDALIEVFAADAAGTYTLGDLAAAIAADPVGERFVYDLVFDALTLADVFDVLLADPALQAGADGAALAELLRNLQLDDLLAQLQALEPPVSLAELFLGVFEPDEYPWEELDLDAAALGLKRAVLPNGVPFSVVIRSTLSTAQFDVTFTLPEGFQYVPGSFGADDGVVVAGEPVPEPQPDGTTVLRSRVTIPEQPLQGETTIGIAAVPPFAVGSTENVEGTVTAVDWAISRTTGNGYTLDDALEDNDDPADPTVLGAPADQLVLSHLTPDDVDWFSVDVTQGEAISLILSNLPVDYDLLVFAPDTEVRLRGAATRSLTPAPDGGWRLLGEEAPISQIAADVDTTAPPGYRLLAGSARRSTEDERIDTTPLAAGTYLVKVTPYNGASSAQPYALRVRSEGSPQARVCPAVAPAGAALPLGSAVTTVGATTDTIILVDTARLARSYGATGAGSATDVIEALGVFTNTLAQAPADRFAGTTAAVVDLATIPAVRAANDAFDAQPCDPQLANRVVAAIGGVLDAVVTPAVRNVVIIGADDQIPMARVRDNTPKHNEQEYAETFVDANPVSAAQALGYMLTDDAYATASPYAVGARDLFVPDLAIGRLVETPTDIANSLANFLAFDGRLDPQTAISTGYDFLEDGARAVGAALKDGVVAPTAVDETLISTGLDAWTREQLAAQFAAAGPDVASVNAHFDHYRAVPADQDAADVLTDPLTTTDVRTAPDDAAGRRPLLGSLIFSMGCHGGLSVSDINVGSLTDDWAETFASQGAAMFAGNTGYGYGDTEVVAFTEELMRLFAERLAQAPTIGAAMAAAKQRYVNDPLEVSPFEEKVSSQVVFYGLPMYRIGGAAPPAPEPTLDVVADPVSGIPSASVGFTQLQPTPVQAENGVRYTVDGEFQATAFQPIQPRTSIDVTATTGQPARGALITSLVSTDVGPIDPVISTPYGDVNGPTVEAPSQGIVFPSTLQSVKRLNEFGTARDRLVVVPGQFRGIPGDPAGLGIQRLFTDIGLQVFYAPDGNADTTPPRIVLTRSVVIDGQVAVEVEVGDTDVSRIVVLYSESGTPGVRTWRSIELSPRDATHWVGLGEVAPGTTEVDYFVQVLDTGGNVSVGSDKGTNFTAAVAPIDPPPPGSPSITVTGPTGPTGSYVGAVVVSAAPGEGAGGVTLTVNGQQLGNPVELTVDGVYEVVASTPGADPVTRVIALTGAPPTVAATVQTPPNGFGWYTAVPVTVDISATPGTSTVASVRYRVGTAAQQTVPGDVVSVPVSTQGEVDVRYSAIDTGGRVSTTETLTLRIDAAAPTITASAPAQATQGDIITIRCSATDATSGVVGGDCADRVVDTGLLDPGPATYTFTAVDAAGNTATASVSVTIIAANTAPVVKADMGVAGLETIGFQSPAVLAVGSFTDREGNGPYTVSVRWGTGPFTSVVLQSGTTFYAPWILLGTAARTVTVRVCDLDGACGTDTLSVRPNVTTRVTPIARCVADRGASVSNRYEARWAYQNPATFAIAIPSIPLLENTFSPLPTWRGQPEIFLPGTRNDVFRTTFASGTQTWRVNGTSATARTTTTRC